MCLCFCVFVCVCVFVFVFCVWRVGVFLCVCGGLLCVFVFVCACLCVLGVCERSSSSIFLVLLHVCVGMMRLVCSLYRHHSKMNASWCLLNVL